MTPAPHSIRAYLRRLNRALDLMLLSPKWAILYCVGLVTGPALMVVLGYATFATNSITPVFAYNLPFLVEMFLRFTVFGFVMANMVMLGNVIILTDGGRRAMPPIKTLHLLAEKFPDADLAELARHDEDEQKRTIRRLLEGS